MYKTAGALFALVLGLASLAFGQNGPSRGGEIRVGIVGLDTGHASIFTQLLNDTSSPQHVPGARVVAAYASGSDLPLSISNLRKVPNEIHDKWNVEIVKDIATLLSKVDAVMLESLDGRVHLDLLKPLLAARKPVFIDKPLAASYKDALEIDKLAREAGVPWWSASSLRYAPALTKLKGNLSGGLHGAVTYGPAALEPTNPGFFWYGIHATEMLFTLLGPGCEEVGETHTDGADVVVGRWKDGRIGVVRGIRTGSRNYGALAFGVKSDEYTQIGLGSLNYPFLLTEVVKFFRTSVPPVSNAETLEIMAFMEAAELSRKAGGAPVKLSNLQ